MRLPLTSFILSQVMATCRFCGASYVSKLAGGSDELRKVLMALMGTAVGLSLIFVVAWSWKVAALGLIALGLIDAALKFAAHSRGFKNRKPPPG
jgi:hypothetical protein